MPKLTLQELLNFKRSVCVETQPELKYGENARDNFKIVLLNDTTQVRKTVHSKLFLMDDREFKQSTLCLFSRSSLPFCDCLSARVSRSVM